MSVSAVAVSVAATWIHPCTPAERNWVAFANEQTSTKATESESANLATVAVSRQQRALPAHSTFIRSMLSQPAMLISTRHITGCHPLHKQKKRLALNTDGSRLDAMGSKKSALATAMLRATPPRPRTQAHTAATPV